MRARFLFSPVFCQESACAAGGRPPFPINGSTYSKRLLCWKWWLYQCSRNPSNTPLTRRDVVAGSNRHHHADDTSTKRGRLPRPLTNRLSIACWLVNAHIRTTRRRRTRRQPRATPREKEIPRRTSAESAQQMRFRYDSVLHKRCHFRLNSVSVGRGLLSAGRMDGA